MSDYKIYLRAVLIDLNVTFKNGKAKIKPKVVLEFSHDSPDGPWTDGSNAENASFENHVGTDDTIQWLFERNANLKKIIAINPKAGNPDLFAEDPSPDNDWKGTIGEGSGSEAYNITYKYRFVENGITLEGTQTAEPKITMRPKL